MELEAVDYLVKLFNLRELLRRCVRTCGAHRRNP